MSVESKVTGGDDQGSGGTEENKPNTDQEKANLVVTREAYERAVTEAKKAKARAAELDKKIQEQHDAELKKNQEWQKIAEQEAQKVKQLEEKLTVKEQQEADQAKTAALLSALPGKVASQYWGLFDLDAIKYDPETGSVDESSVMAAAKEFQAKFTAVIEKPTKGSLPNDAAKGGGAKITIEEWKKLPLNEQKARYAEVFAAYKDK